jgi:hypothetical protein
LLLRALEGLAALLTAGVLVLGVALGVLKVAAPAFIDGSGLSAAGGPRLDRILVPVVVGVVGELLHANRARLPARVRPAVAAGVILVVMAALWWGWWR